MKNNELLMLILAFILGYMCCQMMKSICGDRLVEGLAGCEHATPVGVLYGSRTNVHSDTCPGKCLPKVEPSGIDPDTGKERYDSCAVHPCTPDCSIHAVKINVPESECPSGIKCDEKGEDYNPVGWSYLGPNSCMNPPYGDDAYGNKQSVAKYWNKWSNVCTKKLKDGEFDDNPDLIDFLASEGIKKS